MNFDESDSMIAVSIGYIFMFFIFSGVLFFVLSYFNKLPESWNYIHVFLVSVLIILLGKTIKFWLEK